MIVIAIFIRWDCGHGQLRNGILQLLGAVGDRCTSNTCQLVLPINSLVKGEVSIPHHVCMAFFVWYDEPANMNRGAAKNLPGSASP